MWNLHQNNNQHKTHDFMDKYWAKLCELEEKYTPASFKQVDRGEVLLLSSDEHLMNLNFYGWASLRS